MPGGMIPCPEMLWEGTAAGLETKDSAAFGESYTHTLRPWRR